MDLTEGVARMDKRKGTPGGEHGRLGQPCQGREEHPESEADHAYLLTNSLSSLPGRKKGSFLGLTLTTSPVLGLRPV